MKVKSLYWVLLVILALALVSCQPRWAEEEGGGPADNPAAPVSTDAAGVVSGDEVLITQENAGTVVEIQRGKRAVVKLDEKYDWAISVIPEMIVGLVEGEVPPEGSQGVYEAKMIGKAVIQATGSAKCLKDNPPCTDPNQQFQVNVTVVSP